MSTVVAFPKWGNGFDNNPAHLEPLNVFLGFRFLRKRRALCPNRACLSSPKKIESKYPQISILPKTLRNKKIRTHSQKKREADRGNYLHEQSTLKWAEYNPAFSPGLQRRRTLPVALGVDATPCHWSICLLDSMCLRPFVLCYWTSSARRTVWSLLDCEYLNSS